MPAINVSLEGDGAWPDLLDKEYLNLMGDGTQISIAALKGGMRSGRTSLTFRIEGINGEIVCFETSLRLLQGAVDILTAKFGRE